MNCRRRGKPASGSKQVHKDANKTGDPKSYGDKHGMERAKLEKHPDWEGKGRKVEWK